MISEISCLLPVMHLSIALRSSTSHRVSQTRALIFYKLYTTGLMEVMRGAYSGSMAGPVPARRQLHVPLHVDAFSRTFLEQASSSSEEVEM